MSPAVATKTESKPIEWMTVADAIRADLAAGDAGFRRAGEKLVAQRAALKGEKGAWTAWLKAEGFQARTGQRYMAYAKTDSTVAFAEYLYEHGSANDQEPKVVLPTKPPKNVINELSPAPPDLHVQDDDDEVESEVETIKALPETEPLATKQYTVKAPANEQPTPTRKQPTPTLAPTPAPTAAKAAEDPEPADEDDRPEPTTPDHKPPVGARATKCDEHGVAYLDSRGRRRPNRPLPDRVWNVMNMASTGIEYLGRFLIEARQRGHQDFPQWLQQAIDLNLQMAAVLDLLKGETVPTIEDLEAILNPDDGDPAEPEPAASPSKVTP